MVFRSMHHHTQCMGLITECGPHTAYECDVVWSQNIYYDNILLRI